MISLVVATLICSVCVVNHECKKWENKIVQSQEVEDMESTDEIIKNEEVKTESVVETIEQNIDNVSSVETNVEYSTVTPSDYSNRDVPSNNSIKSYMDYRCITLRSSKQYKLQHSLAYTGDHGLRMVNGRYCIAVGSYYTTTIGQYIDVELSNGNVIHGILADCKSDAHTDSTHRINPNGSVVEFVVDTRTLDSTAKRMGDISYVNGWNSKIVNIKVYNTVEKF